MLFLFCYLFVTLFWYAYFISVTVFYWCMSFVDVSLSKLLSFTSLITFILIVFDIVFYASYLSMSVLLLFSQSFVDISTAIILLGTKNTIYWFNFCMISNSLSYKTIFIALQKLCVWIVYKPGSSIYNLSPASNVVLSCCISIFLCELSQLILLYFKCFLCTIIFEHFSSQLCILF